MEITGFLFLCLMSSHRLTYVNAQIKETRAVNGAKGGSVILQLYRDDVEDVSWVYDGDVRITTKPGEPIHFRDPDHKQNMLAAKDASLIIMDLSEEDEKVYIASLQLKTHEIYKINFDLMVFKNLSSEDIQIEHNITSTKPCGVLLTCEVKGPNVIVTWTNGSTSIATGNVLYVANAHSSLDVTCVAQNPVSRVTRTVKPCEFCTGNGSSDKRIVPYWLLLLLSIIACFV